MARVSGKNAEKLAIGRHAMRPLISITAIFVLLASGAFCNCMAVDCPEVERARLRGAQGRVVLRIADSADMPVEDSKTRAAFGASDSLPDPKQVEIEQSAFFPRADHEQAKRSLLYMAKNGYSVEYNNLPENIQKSVALYSKRNIPRIEFRDANPHDVVGFLAKAGSPSRPIQLSGTDENNSIPDEWVMAIDDCGMKISCMLTNVNLLDLSIRVATVLSLEIGVLEDGNMVFGRSGQWLEDYTPAFTIGVQASEQ